MTMDVDLSTYRLPDDDNRQWMIDAMDTMGFERYMKFESRVVHALDVLLPGKYYDVRDISSNKQELFIKISCIYIQTHPEVVFYSDYSKIEKLILPEKKKDKSKRHEVGTTAHKSI